MADPRIRIDLDGYGKVRVFSAGHQIENVAKVEISHEMKEVVGNDGWMRLEKTGESFITVKLPLSAVTIKREPHDA